MSTDIIYVAQRDPVQYRPGVPRGVRNGSHKEDGEGSHAREIELKRSRGEISCAECRRLKIKCDRQLPCSSCLRRGCASLCPNGSLATGQGTRFVLAATDHLHRRMSKMSERVRQLEDALAILQSSVSEEAHPLLRDELLALKVDRPQEGLESESPHEVPNGIDRLGTLSISDRGSRFFGVSGGSELMFLKDEEEERYSSPSASGGSPLSVPSSTSNQSSKSPRLRPELALFSNAFPFTPIGPVHEIQAKIRSHLPPWEDAIKLAEIYFEQAAWLFRSVSREQLMDEMLPVIYQRAAPGPDHGAGDYEGPHGLSLLFMTFAVGTLVDLGQEPFSAEADHYYQLAKAAIVLQSVFERPNCLTIQTLHLMSIYNVMRQPDGADDGSETSMEMSWSLIRQSVQLAITIGLHRDSARWGLPQREVERRRVLFWDLFVADAWQSLATGRPPCILLPFVDCQFPRDEGARLNEKGKEEPGFNTWMFRFACECVGEVGAKVLTATMPPFATILDLDAKIRDFNIPAFPDNIPLDHSKPATIMARYVLAHCRETILLNLHLSFFAQAMTDDPVNPLRSQYAPSFLATYRSASHIIKNIREEFDLIPALSARFWSPWTYAFSSAVVFGTIVVRGPSSSYAPASLQELDRACQLFTDAGQHSRRAAKASVILQKLKIKAHAAYDLCLHSRSVSELSGIDPQPDPVRKQEKDDELDLFSGRVRLVSSIRGSSGSGSPEMTTSTAPNQNGNTESPPPYNNSVPLTSDGSSVRLKSMQNTVTPLANRATSGLQTHNLSGVRSPELASSGGVYPASATWNGSSSSPGSVTYGDIYPEHGADTPGPFSAGSNTYPQTVKLDEWAAPSTSRATQSNSHSSHPDIRMDGMEYDHGSSASVSSHHRYVSQPPSQQQFPQAFSQPHPHQEGISRVFHHQRAASQLGQDPDPRFHSAYAAPPPSSHPSGHPSAFYHSPGSGGTPPELYATAPRELAEMGLASQHSAVTQRWTSFMQESGLFYGPTGASM